MNLDFKLRTPNSSSELSKSETSSRGDEETNELKGNCHRGEETGGDQYINS